MFLEFTSYFDYEQNRLLYQIKGFQVANGCKLVFNRMLPQYWTIQISGGHVHVLCENEVTVLEVCLIKEVTSVLTIYEIEHINELINLQLTCDISTVDTSEYAPLMTVELYTQRMLCSSINFVAPVSAELLGLRISNEIQTKYQVIGHQSITPNILRPVGILGNSQQLPTQICVDMACVHHVPESMLDFLFGVNDDVAFKIEDYVYIDKLNIAQRSFPISWVDIIHHLRCEVVTYSCEADGDIAITFDDVAFPHFTKTPFYPSLILTKPPASYILVKITLIFSMLSHKVYWSKMNNMLKINYKS